MDPAILTALRTAIAAAVMLGAIAFKPRGKEATDSDSVAMLNSNVAGAEIVQKSCISKSGIPCLIGNGDDHLVASSSGIVLPFPSGGPVPAVTESVTPELNAVESGLRMAMLGGVLAAGVELGVYLFVEVSTEVILIH